MTEVAQAWATIVAEGRAQQLAGVAFLPLIELPSTMAYGLTEGPRWARRHGEQMIVFSEQAAVSFVEALEQPRRDFEATLEKNAAAHGLPGPETAWSFPAQQLISAMLRSETAHFVQLGLRWILPTELRPLRPLIHAVAERSDLSQSLRDLAVHLRVPEVRP